MCIISFEALTSDTIIYSAELPPFEEGVFAGRSRQVLAYRNSIQNQGTGVNAMHIPILTSMDLRPENVLDWSSEPSLLDDIYKELQTKLSSRSIDTTRTAKKANFIVETTDYIIALVNDLDILEETLSDPRFQGYVVPEWVKPFYRKAYGDGQDVRFVWALFKHTDLRPCSPLAFEYVPSTDQVLFFPTMDSHGEAPKMGEDVRMTQKLIMGSYKTDEKGYAEFTKTPEKEWTHTSKVAAKSAFSDYFPKFLYTYDFSRVPSTSNTDKVFLTSKLHKFEERSFVSKFIDANFT